MRTEKQKSTRRLTRSKRNGILVATMTQSTTRGYFFIVLAALLWSMIGWLMRTLHDQYSFSALTLAFLRAGIAFVILFAILAIVQRNLLQINRQSIMLLAFFGLFGIALFYFVYAQAIITTSVTTAVVLLYTAPAFVTLIAWRVWDEPLTPRKLFAVGLAFIGCALVARAYDTEQLQLNFVGVLFGLGAGLTYGLFTIFTKAGQKRFPLWTLMTYELFFGALFLLPAQNPNELVILARQPMAWLYLLTLVLGSTLGAIAAFTRGLRDVPASNASVVATIEPVMASALAFLILGERLEVWQIVGGGLVIAGALWLARS